MRAIVTGTRDACPALLTGQPVTALLEDIVTSNLARVARNYEWIHVSLGLFGNLLFVAGSCMFLSEQLKTGALWLFVAGSTLMLTGALGNAVIKLWRVEEGEKDAPPPVRRLGHALDAS